MKIVDAELGELSRQVMELSDEEFEVFADGFHEALPDEVINIYRDLRSKALIESA